MKKIFALIIGVCCFWNVAFASAGQLDVPYYNQAGSDWCWAGSATMVAGYYVPPQYRSGDYKNYKIWEAAAFLDKAYDDGGSLTDIKTVLGGWVASFDFNSEIVTNNDSIKSKIIERISLGHPVIFASIDNEGGAHAFVVVGATSDYVYINDSDQ